MTETETFEHTAASELELEIDKRLIIGPPYPPVFLADSSDRPTWLAKREGGVTATQAAMIVNGSRATFKRLHKLKTEGETFRGNAATERGRRREEKIAGEILRRFDILPSGMLYASGEDPRLLATPDCYTEAHPRFGRVGAEIKSTVDDYSVIIPTKYLDQLLWQMVVTGADVWLFAWEPCDADGQPLLLLPDLEEGKHFRWIRRADHLIRIAKLVGAVRAYLAWVDAGCPERDDDLPDEVEDALALHADARARKLEAEADEKAAEAVVRGYIAADPDRAKGTAFGTELASVSYTVDSDATAFDAEAWARRAPRRHAEWLAAQERYRKTKPKSRLVITPAKPKPAAA